MPSTALTPAQRAVLTLAAQTRGRLEQFPPTLHGGARIKVVHALSIAGLVERVATDYRLTSSGYAAIGRTPPGAPAPASATHKQRGARAKMTREQLVKEVHARFIAQQTEAGAAGDAAIERTPPCPPAPAPRSRANSKQAQVIALLQRPEGATIAQLCQATGWQPHTVRGTFAGVLKRKLGLSLHSEKTPGGARVYRLALEAPTVMREGV